MGEGGRVVARRGQASRAAPNAIPPPHHHQIHYMQDRERGVVWEEAIIFLPKGTRGVFLSATLSNAAEFAGWVSSLRNAPCHVVYTDYRPTPLQHYGFPLGGKGLYLLCDERGTFRSDNFARMRREAFNLGPGDEEEEENGGGGGPATATPSTTDRDAAALAAPLPTRGPAAKSTPKTGAASLGDAVAKLVRLAQARSLDPLIIFSFSRRACESYAGALTRGTKAVTFNSESEAATVEAVFTRAVALLAPEDASLKAVAAMLPMLRAGVGVHHSGLLPMLKELVELLFQEGLIKVLCATETFAMGLNMPARTVAFTELRKWDGECTRWMSSGEYIQMSGRAGRRGTDDRGLCVAVCDDAVDARVARALLRGAPRPLLSSFRLSYYTLLNLARRGDGGGEGGVGSMEAVVAKSFRQYQYESARPALAARLAAIEAALKEVEKEGASAGEAVDAALAAAASARRVLRDALLRPDRAPAVLRPGRLVRVVDGPDDWGWGIVVALGGGGGDDARVDALVACDPASLADPAAPPRPAVPPGSGEVHVVPVPIRLIEAVSSLRVGIPADLRPPCARAAAGATLASLAAAHPAGPPLLDPMVDMGDTDPAVRDAAAALAAADAALAAAAASVDPAALAAATRAARLKEEATVVTASLRASQLDLFRDEAARRARALRALGHLDAAGRLTAKGKAAAEIDAADELLAAELMFSGAFGGLAPAHLAALVSCLVPVEKSDAPVELAATMAGHLATLQGAAHRVAAAAIEAGVAGVDADAYVASFAPTLMDAVAAWASGVSFADVVERTDMFEGSLVRAVRRLDEVLAQLGGAAATAGDAELSASFAAASAAVRRGIVFAASLYI